MGNIETALAPLILADGFSTVKRGRSPIGERAMTNAEKLQRHRAPKYANRRRCIAVLDMETDPFDDRTRAPVFPFTCEIYSDQFGSIVIWETDFEKFVDKLYHAIISLPDCYTIYAHNGGKFDFMFLISKLRGQVKFKGRSIMAAKIGNHELRDSLHILPEKLAAWKKDVFDYSKLTNANRHKYKAEILAYQHSDCVYLFDFIKSFVKEFGLKISIGQAAFGELKKHYKTAKITEQMDAFLRRYFFGGRVECIAGRGYFESAKRPDGFKLYDVNSMYPYAMAHYKHPIGNEYNWRRGDPDENTVFVDVECVNHGALIAKADDLMAMPGDGYGRYYTTKRELDVAMKYGLVENVRIVGCVDNKEQSNFAKFIVPMYDRRQIVKAKKEPILQAKSTDCPEFEELHKEDLFLKYLLNNAYGKFAQNPRRFRDYYYTDPGERPPYEWLAEIMESGNDELIHKYGMPVERADAFHVWARPSPIGKGAFNNVGTGASITGTARALLLEAIQHADDPIYCDTDSIMCRRLTGFDLHQTRLGAWKIEQEFDAVIIAGKKEYACKVSGYPDGHDKRHKIRCKGAPGLTWDDFEKLLRGDTVEKTNRVPTITRTGAQYYLTRRIRATADARGVQMKGKAHDNSRFYADTEHAISGERSARRPR